MARHYFVLEELFVVHDRFVIGCHSWSIAQHQLVHLHLIVRLEILLIVTRRS